MTSKSTAKLWMPIQLLFNLILELFHSQDAKVVTLCQSLHPAPANAKLRTSDWAARICSYDDAQTLAHDLQDVA